MNISYISTTIIEYHTIDGFGVWFDRRCSNGYRVTVSAYTGTGFLGIL